MRGNLEEPRENIIYILKFCCMFWNVLFLNEIIIFRGAGRYGDHMAIFRITLSNQSYCLTAFSQRNKNFISCLC